MQELTLSSLELRVGGLSSLPSGQGIPSKMLVSFKSLMKFSPNVRYGMQLTCAWFNKMRGVLVKCKTEIYNGSMKRLKAYNKRDIMGHLGSWWLVFNKRNNASTSYACLVLLVLLVVVLNIAKHTILHLTQRSRSFHEGQTTTIQRHKIRHDFKNNGK